MTGTHTNTSGADDSTSPLPAGSPAPRPYGRPRQWAESVLQRPLSLVLVSVLGAALAGLGVRLIGVHVVDTDWRWPVVVFSTVAAGLCGGVLPVLARRSGRLAASLGVVASGVLLSGLSAAALNGTRWGWLGLHGDSAFRTQMATRYADHLDLVDYGYRGLPAYYPPALGWLEGRVAAATGLAGWETVKPAQLLLVAVVPVLAYALWRQIVRAPLAAAVACLTAAGSIHPQKPDEWLVITCLVPWWVLTVRDVRAPGVERWPAWRLGVVLGLLLLTHTYYFLPLAVATALALGYDVARRRTRLPWRRAAAIGAVGLLVSAPYWVSAGAVRLRLPSDSLQMQYTYLGSHMPEPESVGLAVMEVAGLVWLVRYLWRRRTAGEAGADQLAGALAFAVAGSVLTLGIGALAMRLDIGFLAFKTTDLVNALLLACGVVGVARLLEQLPRRAPWRTAAPAVAVAVAAVLVGHHFASDWVTGRPALTAHATRYPSGSVPHSPASEKLAHPTLFVDPSDPSVTQMRDAWRSLRPDTPLDEAVLVTSHVDLLATTPVYGFVAFKSIYSHPNGQFRARIELLEKVASCSSSRCAAELLRDNEFDAVDGLVLERDGDRLMLRFTVDDFPHRTRYERVEFPSAVLRGEEFVRRDLGSIVVVALRP